MSTTKTISDARSIAQARITPRQRFEQVPGVQPQAAPRTMQPVLAVPPLGGGEAVDSHFSFGLERDRKGLRCVSMNMETTVTIDGKDHESSCKLIIEENAFWASLSFFVEEVAAARDARTAAMRAASRG